MVTATQPRRRRQIFHAPSPRRNAVGDFDHNGVVDFSDFTTVLQNYNASSTNSSWIIAERFVYSPYGVTTTLNPDFTVRSSGDYFAWNVGFQGMLVDSATGLNFTQTRVYEASTGRFLTVDPAHADGMNWYRGFADNPVNREDPSGLVASVQQATDADWAEAIRLGHLPHKRIGNTEFSAICDSGKLVGLAIDLAGGTYYLPDGTALTVAPNTTLGAVVGNNFVAFGTDKQVAVSPKNLTHPFVDGFLGEFTISAMLFSSGGILLRDDITGKMLAWQSWIDSDLPMADLGNLATITIKVVNLAKTVCNPCNNYKFWQDLGNEIEGFNAAIRRANDFFDGR